MLGTQSHRSTATFSSPTRQGSTQSRSTPPKSPNWQEVVEEHPTATITTVGATPTSTPGRPSCIISSSRRVCTLQILKRFCPASLVALFWIRLAASTVQYSTLVVLIPGPSCSWQNHVQLSRVESESRSSRFRQTEVHRIFALSGRPVTSFRISVGHEQGREMWEGNITHSFTHTPTSYRNIPKISPSSGTGASVGSRHRLCCPAALT